MKKTTVMIDEDLLEQAVQAIGARSKREAIIVGLQTLVKRKNKKSFCQELGTFDLDLDLESLEELRNAD